MTSTKARERLQGLGWMPVYAPRVAGKLKLGHLALPVVDGFRVAGWRHPRLEFDWPQGDALQLESDRDYDDPQAVELLGVDGPSLLRRARKARLRVSIDPAGALLVAGGSRRPALAAELHAHEAEVVAELRRESAAGQKSTADRC